MEGVPKGKDCNAFVEENLHGVFPFGGARCVDAVGDDEEDAAAGVVREVKGDADNSIPEVKLMGAGRFVLCSVKGGGGEHGGDGGVKIDRAGWNVLEGTDEGAVEGVEGDVILSVQVGGGEGREGFAETLEEDVLVAAGVEQDGGVDGVVALAVHPGGVER